LTTAARAGALPVPQTGSPAPTIPRVTGDEAALATAVDQLRSASRNELGDYGQGSLVVIDAPPALASKVDVWGSLAPQTLEVMRRLKVRFDPNYILNPGRFVGGI